MSEVPPPANPGFLQTVLPVKELPDQPAPDRQASQEGSQQAPVEPTTPATSGGHTDPAVSLSETIARLQPGAQLEIQPAGVNPEGQPLVRADSGHVFVNLGQNLAPAAQYVVEIVSVGPVIRATVVTTNGVPLAEHTEIQLQPVVRAPDGINQTYRPAPGVPFPNLAAPVESVAGPPIEIGNRLNTLLITRQNEPGAAQTPVIAGSALAVQVIGLTQPTFEGSAKPVGLQLAAQYGAAPSPTSVRIPPINRAQAVAELFRSYQSGEQTAGDRTPQPTPIGTRVPPDNPLATAATIATIIKGSPVTAAKNGVAPGMPGSVITGIVVTSAQESTVPKVAPNQTTVANVANSAASAASQLVRTPIGLLRLNASEGLPVGSTIALEVISTRSPEEIPVREITSPLLNLTATWPVLDEVIETLAATDPALATQTIQRALPTPTPRIGTTLLFFMAALSLGDARNWLGQAATAALENAGRHDLIRRLGADFSRIRRTAEESKTREPGSSEWRPTVFPLLDGGVVRPLTLFTRHGSHHGENGENSSETRFVLDLSLSNLGPVQFDGLVRNRHFDLMVRSHKPFPEQMRDDIRLLFRQAIEPTELDGGVQFQTANIFPVSPKNDYLQNREHISDSMVV